MPRLSIAKKQQIVDMCNKVLHTKFKYFSDSNKVRYCVNHFRKNELFSVFHKDAEILLERHKNLKTAASPIKAPALARKVIETFDVVVPKVRYCRICKEICNKSYFFCDKHKIDRIFQEWDYNCILNDSGL